MQSWEGKPWSEVMKDNGQRMLATFREIRNHGLVSVLLERSELMQSLQRQEYKVYLYMSRCIDATPRVCPVFENPE